MKAKDRKERQRRQPPCQVCHLKLQQPETNDRLTCVTCTATVHRNCYHPDFEEKGKNKFKCDQCKFIAKAKDARLACSVCGGDRQKGLLKNVGNEEWMHVLCALSSSRTRLASYGTLAFIVEGNLQKKGVKAGTRCGECNFDRCAGVPCSIPGCPRFAHLNCVAQPQPQNGQGYSAFLTIGLLDKHEDSLLAQLRGLRQPALKGLSLYRKPPPDLRFYVCAQHNSDQHFRWCACGGDGTGNSIECERCKRWYHRECSPSSEHCRGCVDNNIFARMATLPELVGRAAEVEKVSSLDKTHIRFLDNFCLKLSEQMLKIIGNSEFQVERYYLRKFLEEADIANPEQESTAFEAIYYLAKRELKAKEDIATGELEEIIRNFSRDNKFEWNRTEKVEKRFKGLLEGLLQAIRRDGTREIKGKLQEFVRNNRDPARTQTQVAADLGELVKILEVSEGWKQSYAAFPTREPDRHLIEFFYELKLPQEEVGALLSAMRTIFNPKAKGTLLESDYNSLLPVFNRTLPEPKCKVFQSVFEGLLRGLALRRGYKQKQQLRFQLEQRVKTARSAKERQGIKASILNNRLLISSSSPLMQIERDSIEVAVLKRKLLRKYTDPAPEELQEALGCLGKLMEIDRRSQALSEHQRREFQHLELRLAFYDNIRRSAEGQQRQSSSEEMQQQQQEDGSEGRQVGGRIQRPSRCPSLRDQAMTALMDWRFDYKNSITLALNQCNKLATRSVDFQEKEREIVRQFCEGVLGHFNRTIEEGMTPTGQLLEKLQRIAAYCEGGGRFPIVGELYSRFHAWKQELDAFEDISIALESPRQTEALMRVVERKLEEARLVGLQLVGEVRKLKLVRLWGQLSLKLHPGQRPTIASVQTTRALMERIAYPNNSLRRKVQSLDSESRSLNKRISLFLEKPKLADLQPYEELRVMAGKMTLADGVELQNDLELSELDVEVELAELLEEIREFRGFPRDVSGEGVQEVETLLALRRKLLENAFRLEGGGLEDYHRLLCRITQLRCQEYEPGSNINKKDYFRYINCGPPGAQLFADTPALYRAYKDVEKAEKEVLTAKPRYELLLPVDCRRLKEDLREDAGEAGKVARWCMAAQKARERYRKMRSGRTDLQSLNSIEQQLLRLPVNNREILQQIANARRQLQELTTKVRSFMESSDPTLQYQSPFVAQLVNRYRSIGVRNDYLDRFQGVFARNRAVMDFAKFPTPEKYGRFRRDCEEFGELINNNEVYRAREAAFYRLSEMYLQAPEAMVEVGYLLLGEGGFLLRYPAKADAVIARIIQIHGKFNKWNQRGEGQRREQDELQEDDIEGSEQLEGEQGEGEEEEQQQDQQDDEGLFEQDLDEEDSFESEESSSHRQPRKRPRPSNEVVQLDDD